MTGYDRRPFDRPLSTPLSTADGTIERRKGVVLAAREGTAVVGLGEATPLAGWTEPLADCRVALDTVAAAAERAGTAPSDLSPDADPVADAPAARHAVETLRLDARGRQTGRSLAALLADDGPFDAASAGAVPVNATVGDGDREETVTAAERAVAAGFDTLKLKVGARDLAGDLARVEAVRAAAPDATLRVDANGAWDPGTARTAVNALGDRGVAVVEQPVPAEALDELSSLARPADGGGSPDRPLVTADEALTYHPVDRVAAAADALVLKPMALGGPAAALDAAAVARAAGAEAIVTTTIDAVIARTAAVAVAAAIPAVPACGLATASYLDADLAPDPAPVADGTITVPDDPGLAGDALDGAADPPG